MYKVPDSTDVIDAANYAPFSNDLEKDKVFLTNRDTRCLNVLLNLCFPL